MIRKRQEFTVLNQDLSENTGIGIAVPFNSDRVFKTTYTSRDQVKSNLINYLLTNTGERMFNPAFGADIRTFVFEQMNSTEELREIIREKIDLYIPQVSVTEINMTKDDDDNSVFIQIKYVFNNQEDQLVIQINE